jgi:hypothetical protein
MTVFFDFLKSDSGPFTLIGAFSAALIGLSILFMHLRQLNNKSRVLGVFAQSSGPKA